MRKMDMMEKNILLLLGIFLFCGCGSSRKVLKEYRAQKRHYYLVQGYRPVALSDKKTGAENPFPLSAYEKETLLDSVTQVCRTYLENIPTIISTLGPSRIVRLISVPSPLKSFSSSNRIITGLMLCLRFGVMGMILWDLIFF